MKKLYFEMLALALVFSGAAHASPAGAVCQSLPFSSDRIECLNIISDKYFNEGAVQICSELPFTSDKLSCMKNIANHTYDTDGLRICRSLSFTSDRLSCVSTVAGNTYQASATEICLSMPFSSDRTSCAKTVANKYYNSDELAICSTIAFTSDRLSCLSRAGHFEQEPTPAPDPQPAPPYSNRGCERVIQKITDTCDLSTATLRYLSRRTQICDTARSRSGATELQVLLQRGSGNVIAVDTRGQRACKAFVFQFQRSEGVADLNSVHGIERSDKVFFRLKDGKLYFMDLRHRVFEVENANGCSYNIVGLKDLGNETIELTHRAGNTSTLTFEQIDERRREGKVDEVLVTTPEWDSLPDPIHW